jgi:flagellar biogenesis protein FliO
MAKKDMIKIEYLIILVSLFVILLWAISRCGEQREKVLQDQSRLRQS